MGVIQQKISLIEKPFDFSTLHLSATLKVHEKGVNDISLTATGKLISCSDDRTIKIIDLKTYKVENIIKGNDSFLFVSSIKNGDLFTAVDNDTVIFVWSFPYGVPKLKKFLLFHHQWITNVIQISNNRIASSSGDMMLIIWDENYEMIMRLTGHKDYIYTLILLRNKKHIVSGSGKEVIFWREETYECVKILGDAFCHYGGLCEATDNKILSGALTKIFIINGLTFQVESVIYIDQNFGNVYSLCYLNNKTFIFGTDKGGIIQVEDIECKLIKIKRLAHTKEITRLLFLKDGRVISSSKDSLIKIWKN